MADRGRGGRGQGDFRGRGRGEGGRGRGGSEGGGRGRGGFDGGDRGRGGFDGGGRGRGGFDGGGRGRGGSDGGGRGRGGFDGGARGRGGSDGGGRGRGGSDGGGRGRGGFDRGGGGFRGGRGGGEPAKFWGNGAFPQPDAETTKAEDASVSKDISIRLAATSIDEYVLPRRPGYGKLGRPIILWTNYFELKGIKPDTTLYRYSVAFQPDSDDLKARKKKRLIQQLLMTTSFSKVASASDGTQTIITSKKVDLGGTRQKYDIEWYPEDGEPLPPQASGEQQNITGARTRSTFRLLVEEIGDVSLQELVKDLSKSTVQYPLKLETIQALNIVLSHGPASDPKIMGTSHNKFYPFGDHPLMETTDLGYGLRALRGYFSSVRTGVSRILVNINVATGAFYKEGSLVTLMQDFGRPNNASQHQELVKFVRLLNFETHYMTERDTKSKAKKGKSGAVKKRKVHSIANLSAFGKNAQNTEFERVDASGAIERVTVEAYFKNQWGITLKLPQAPLVDYNNKIPKKPKDAKWIPAELCFVLPGQLAKRMLKPDQTREMIEFAARRPYNNAESIMNNGLKVTKISPELNAKLTAFGINVDPKLLTVNGRILTPPTLQYRTKPCTPSNGAWNLNPMQLGAQPFPLVRPLGSWNCMVINSGNYETIRGGINPVVELLELFRKTLTTYGLSPGPVNKPAIVNINEYDLLNLNITKVQKDITQAVQDNFHTKPNFLFVILPSENAVLYDSIKYVFDVQYGVPTICNIGKKISKEKGQIQYFSNVAMKFNQKLGGMNHSIKIESMKPLDTETILFGIDVTHPSPGSSESSPSIAGVVASVDKNFAQYPASIRTQKGKKEMVTELEDMIKERLQLWQKRNGRLPNKVIVYRDGVSEGQYRTVMVEEYPAFVKAFEKLYGASSRHPKISIIVVGKRHHTRFYPTKEEDSDGRTGNPKPGTVVDRGVTGEALFDFFLLAHQGLQGTSKPAHYVVLKDDNKFGADQLQGLTHNLCYTFARATRAVSICPPAYYADLLCERGRCYLHGTLKGKGDVDFTQTTWRGGVHSNLAETMFYL